MFVLLVKNYWLDSSGRNGKRPYPLDLFSSMFQTMKGNIEKTLILAYDGSKLQFFYSYFCLSDMNGKAMNCFLLTIFGF